MFVAAGAVLVLEILAVRLLAPYVGLTLETTTSIIGAALAGIAAGAALGGFLADRTETRRLIALLLMVGGVLTMLTVPAVRLLGPGLRGQGDGAALLITIVALVPAAAVLSAVSPAVAHLQLQDLRLSGTVVGRLSAWATAGALIGTFGTGFVIVPLIAVSTAVLLCGVVLALYGIGLALWGRLLGSEGVIAAALGVIVVGGLSTAPSSPCERESDYHCVSVEGDPLARNSYELVLDNARNSYVDLDDPTRLEYRYTRWIAAAVDLLDPAPAPLDAVFVGGGGFTLPRWLLATRPGSEATVLEVDGGVVEVAEDKLGLRPSATLRVEVGDARITALDLPDESADLIVGDAFSGYSVPWHLTTREWMDEVRRVMRPHGVYALNLIDYRPLGFVEAELATLLESFGQVRMIALAAEDGPPVGGNVVLLASDSPLPRTIPPGAADASLYGQAEVEALAADSDPLRDDHAPVDQLQTLPAGS